MKNKMLLSVAVALSFSCFAKAEIVCSEALLKTLRLAKSTADLSEEDGQNIARLQARIRTINEIGSDINSKEQTLSAAVKADQAKEDAYKGLIEVLNEKIDKESACIEEVKRLQVVSEQAASEQAAEQTAADKK